MNLFLKLIIFIAIDIYIFRNFGKLFGFLGLGIIIYRFLYSLGFLRTPKIYRGAFNEGVAYLKDYKGKYLEFDAKETKSKTSFPISNIHKHQMEHIERVIHFGGIAFLIVRFSSLNLTYLILGEDVIGFEELYHRKSIPLSFFEEYGYKIELKYSPRLDYIKIIDKIIREVKK